MKPKKSSGAGAAGCLALFGLPFLLAGLFITWWFYSQIFHWWSAQKWVEVPCWIESTELKEHSGDDGTNYEVLATYRYDYEGVTYRSDRVTFHIDHDGRSGFNYDAHRQLSAHLGRKIPGEHGEPDTDEAEPFRCFINPSKPSEAVLFRELRWQLLGFLVLFVLTFPAVGAAVCLGGMVGIQTAIKEKALQSQYPDKPWKWKLAWAGDVIPTSSRPGRWMLCAYTLWSGAAIFSVILATALSGAFQSEKNAWFLMIYLLIWLPLLWLALKSIRYHLRFGTIRFEPKSWPWWPGGTMYGQLLLQKPIPMRGHSEAVLSCSKSISRGTGEDRKTTTETLWTQKLAVTPEMMIRDFSGFRVPIHFTIPADAPETIGDSSEDESLSWNLVFKVAGTSIQTKFEVPVFRTSETLRSLSRAVNDTPTTNPSVLDQAEENLSAQLSANRITATFDAQEHPLTLYCPPAKERSILIFLIFFNLIWTGVAVFLLKKDAPLIFQIIWPASCGLIWLLIIRMLLHHSLVTFDDHGLLIVEKIGPFSWRKPFDKSSIKGFEYDSNMSSGNTIYYRVKLLSDAGKKHVIISGITSSTAAEILKRRLDSWRTGHQEKLQRN